MAWRKRPSTVIEIPYAPTKVQWELHMDPTRFKVGVFGRRSGKSVYAINESIKVGMEKAGARIWIICPTYGQAKDIYWRGANMLNLYLIPEIVKKKNESDLVIELKNGSVIQFKGADRPETLRGSALDLIILDEVAEHRYGQETWEQILLPSLSDRNGSAIFIGTPRGYDFLYDLYERGQSGNAFWKSWRVPTWESGAPWTLTIEGKDELARLKAEMSEDAWFQEYGAEFRKYTGLVYKTFDRTVHVKEFEVLPNYPLEIGMDFGWTNPTTCVFSYFDKDDNMYVFDEYCNGSPSQFRISIRRKPAS